jgi:hypothetical protein
VNPNGPQGTPRAAGSGQYDVAKPRGAGNGTPPAPPTSPPGTPRAAGNGQDGGDNAKAPAGRKPAPPVPPDPGDPRGQRERPVLKAPPPGVAAPGRISSRPLPTPPGTRPLPPTPGTGSSTGSSTNGSATGSSTAPNGTPVTPRMLPKKEQQNQPPSRKGRDRHKKATTPK